MRCFALLMPLVFAACVPGDVPPDPGIGAPATPPAASCGAPALQGLVGQPATVLHTMKFGTTVRIIRPGMAVTMDYSEDRLNIEIDKAEVISRVSCG